MSLDNFITGSSNVFGSLVSFAITLLEFTRILGFDANLYLQHFWLVSQLYKPDQERQSPLTMSQNFIKYGNAPLEDYYFALKILSWPCLNTAENAIAKS